MQDPIRLKSSVKSLAAVLAMACLSACGGGGGDDEGSISGNPNPGSGGGSDSVAPVVSITSPDDDGNAIVAGSSVVLAGEASDNIGVQSLRWQNSRGGEGQIQTGSSWQSPSITLQSGINAITVEAEDAAGNKSADTIMITQESASGSGGESTALISYGAGLSNATMLQGANVQRRVAYIFFALSEEWEERGIVQIDFYCCKSLSGESENHLPRVVDNSEPFVFNVDLGQFVGGNQRELYADVYFQDGTQDNVYVQFNLEAGSPGGGNNTAPTISGSPPTQVTAGQGYSFTPSANDADGDALTFTIQNRPSWASFNMQTGQLSGTPGAGDGGTYSNIRIGVTDGVASSQIPSFDLTVSAVSNASLTINWTPPTQNVDGSPIAPLAGFRIFYGQTPGSYPNEILVNDGGLTSYTIDNLVQGTWYLAMTAVDINSLESALSYEVSKTAQ
ncbi:MAG: putative Ig domain-containing protein [Pseudomonadota bacterium]